MTPVRDERHSSVQPPRNARRYAFACVQCRQKKIKCDGEQPHCRRCQRADETCQYPQRATDSSLAQAQARIVELEAELVSARQTPGLVPQESMTSDSASGDVIVARHPSASRTDDPEDEDLSPHIGLDENGGVTYNGPTSRFYASSIGELPPVTPRASEMQPTLRESNANLLHQVWEPFLEAKTESELGARPALVRRLLDIYWTWQHPLHHCVHKPCFIMDMALGGPYFSKFLLHCMCSLAARHLDAESLENVEVEKGETFLRSARELLVRELAASKPRIPTIQGLLILGGRQCAVGKSSEGWLFTGMAQRMITDLGLHLNLHRLAELEKLTAVDLELRKRLYCSAYIWDKSLSLSLGRPPSLSKPPSHLNTLDRTDDGEIWAPLDFPNYPPTNAFNTLCLQHFCQLGSVIELIMRPVSESVTLSRLQDRISNLEQKLSVWYGKLPDVLRMGEDCIVCPPPHILSLNLLYHTLHIILWRPHLYLQQLASHAAQVCMNKAEVVHRMFLLYGQSFQWRKMTYLISYCVYTAATVDVEEMKSSNQESRGAAAKRLAVSLKILESEAKQTPGIRRSIDIIKRQLRTWTRNAYTPLISHRHSDSASSFASQQSRTANGASSNGRQQASNDTGMGFPDPAVGSSTPAAYPYMTNDLQTVLGVSAFEFGDTGAGFQPDAFPWPDAWNMDTDFFDSGVGNDGMLNRPL